MDFPDRVSRKYSLLINVDKTKVTASDGVACYILIQNEQLVNTFSYLGSLITEDGDGRILYQVEQRAGDWDITADNMEKSQHTDFNKDKTNKSTGL